jgi:hypothetical protein
MMQNTGALWAAYDVPIHFGISKNALKCFCKRRNDRKVLQ